MDGRALARRSRELPRRRLFTGCERFIYKRSQYPLYFQYVILLKVILARNVTCDMKDACEASRKPPETKLCPQCYVWWAGPWEACSCSEGVARRRLTCTVIGKDDAEPDEFCEDEIASEKVCVASSHDCRFIGEKNCRDRLDGEVCRKFASRLRCRSNSIFREKCCVSCTQYSK